MKLLILFILSSLIAACSDSYRFTPASIATNVTNPPGEFNLQTLVRGNSKVSLTWSTSAGATSYTVKYGTISGNHPTIVSTNATRPFEIPNLTNGVEYFFTVIAENEFGSVQSGVELSAEVIFIDDFSQYNLGSIWQLGTDPGSYASPFTPTTGFNFSSDGSDLILESPSAVSGTFLQLYETVADYDFSDSWVSAEYSMAPVNDGLRFREVGLWIMNSASDGWEMFVVDGNLFYGSFLYGGGSFQWNTPYVEMLHKHIRIRHDSIGDVIIFEASGDGVTWTTLNSMARNSIPIDHLHFTIYGYVDNNGHGPNGPMAKFNDIRSNAPEN